MKHIVFWQRMFSPHMMGLAEALACRGIKVTFIATEELSQARREQGWQVMPKGEAERRIVNNSEDASKFIAELEPSTIHITQGLRGNFEIRAIQEQIEAAGQRLWVIMETVDPGGWRAPLKRATYRWESIWRRRKIEGVLAIGAYTADWLVARGFPACKVFPFAYFISPPQICEAELAAPDRHPFTFGFIGNLEPWKNPELAIDAFIDISQFGNRLLVVGDGSLRPALEQSTQIGSPQADIRFLGRQPMSEVPQILEQIDCLLLPSNVDGWGVVASEAMLVGTPVVVSSACGVHLAVKAAPAGAVFPAGDLSALKSAMLRMQAAGRDPIRRDALRAWAASLGADFGAEYLEQITSGTVGITLPDWLLKNGTSV